jgi:cytochrome c553
MHTLHRPTFALAAACLLGRPAVAADDALGAFLAETCAACHQANVQNSAIPSIVGMDEATFIALMRLYRSGERPDAIMQAVAGSLSDDETAALAHFLATQVISKAGLADQSGLVPGRSQHAGIAAAAGHPSRRRCHHPR